MGQNQEKEKGDINEHKQQIQQDAKKNNMADKGFAVKTTSQQKNQARCRDCHHTATKRTNQ